MSPSPSFVCLKREVVSFTPIEVRLSPRPCSVPVLSLFSLWTCPIQKRPCSLHVRTDKRGPKGSGENGASPRLSSSWIVSSAPAPVCPGPRRDQIGSWCRPLHSVSTVSFSVPAGLGLLQQVHGTPVWTLRLSCARLKVFALTDGRGGVETHICVLLLSKHCGIAGYERRSDSALFTVLF